MTDFAPEKKPAAPVKTSVEPSLQMPPPREISRQEIESKLLEGAGKKKAEMVVITGANAEAQYAQALRNDPEYCKQGPQRCTPAERQNIKTATDEAFRDFDIFTTRLGNTDRYIVVLPGFTNRDQTTETLRKSYSPLFSDAELNGTVRNGAVRKALIDWGLYHEGAHLRHFYDSVPKSEALADGRGAFLLLRDAYRSGDQNQIDAAKYVLGKIDVHHIGKEKNDYTLGGLMIRRLAAASRGYFLSTQGEDIEKSLAELLQSVERKK